MRTLMRFGDGRKAAAGARRAQSVSFRAMAIGSRLLLFCSLPLALSACAGSREDAGYSVTEAVRYASAPVANDARVGDFYRPDGAGPFPAVLLIHGGSWQRGSRGGYSRSLASIPPLCGLGTRIRSQTLISRPTSGRCLSRSTSLSMARLLLTQALTDRISHCKTRRLCPSTIHLHFWQS